MKKTDFNLALISYMEKERYSLSQLAKMAGKDISQLSKWKSGLNEPYGVTLKHLKNCWPGFEKHFRIEEKPVSNESIVRVNLPNPVKLSILFNGQKLEFTGIMDISIFEPSL